MLIPKRCVIDTNWLSNTALEEYLARSSRNHAVLAEMTLVEVHKEAASLNGRRLMKTLCRYPRQVIILRSTRDLYRDGGAGKGLADRLTEATQTAQFGEYCRTVIDAPDDDLIDDHFALMEEQSRGQISTAAYRDHAPNSGQSARADKAVLNGGRGRNRQQKLRIDFAHV